MHGNGSDIGSAGKSVIVFWSAVVCPRWPKRIHILKNIGGISGPGLGAGSAASGISRSGDMRTASVALELCQFDTRHNFWR